jgi:hypothetical protein
MKPVLILLFIVTPFILFCQEASWKLVKHPFAIEEAREEITDNCRQGFLPIGLEMDEGRSIFILYAKDSTLSFKNWFLYQFEDLENIEADFSYILQKGWIPLDISKTEDFLYVLFIKTDLNIEGWRLSRTDTAPSVIEKELGSFRSQGFSIWGMSLFNTEVWYLFIKQPQGVEKEIFLNTYKNNSEAIKNGITKDISNGWLPWALMMEAKDIFVLYTRHY